MNRIRYNSLSRFADIVCDFPNKDYLDIGLNIMHDKDPSAGLSKVFPNCKIFIKTDLVPSYSQALREINVPFHLFTGSSDITLNIDILDIVQQNKNMLTWTGQNLIKFGERFLQVPIGFQELGSGRPNSYFYFPEPTIKPIPVVLTPVSATTGSRNNISNILGTGILNIQNRLSYKDYIDLLGASKYSICPVGNGIDTHRVMESIVMRSKPIVLSSPLNSMYSEMGCAIVNDWNEITNLSLDNCDINPIVTTLAYWENRINQHHLNFERRND